MIIAFEAGVIAGLGGLGSGICGLRTHLHARGKDCVLPLVGRFDGAMPVRRYGDEAIPDYAVLSSVIDHRTWTHRTQRGALRRRERLWRDMDTQARARSDIAIYRRGPFEFVVRFERVVPPAPVAPMSVDTSMTTLARH